MAGVLLNLIPKREFNFNSVRVGETQSFVIAEQIDISQYCDGILLTRLHAVSCGGGNIFLFMTPDGYTPRDSLVFSGSAVNYFNHNTIIGPPSTAGTVIAQGGTPGSFGGEFAMVNIKAIRAFAMPLELRATISVDLLLRSPDDLDGNVYQTVLDAGGCGCTE